MDRKDHSDVRAKLELVRKLINDALPAIAQQAGVAELKLGRGRFSDENFRFELEGIFAGGKSRDATRYEQLREMTPGLPELGWTFRSAGKDYTVTGCNSTGSKVIARCRNSGKDYLFPVDAIRRHATVAAATSIAKVA